jgi:hypothetical protein
MINQDHRVIFGAQQRFCRFGDRFDAHVGFLSRVPKLLNLGGLGRRGGANRLATDDRKAGTSYDDAPCFASGICAE